MNDSDNGLTYRDAGVDIDAGNRLVERIKPLAKTTARPGLTGGIGGFGGLFDPKEAGFSDPILVSTTDGVGTKLKLAIEHGRHDTVGIDLVAMCVNDLLCQGATPLFFLDYFATSRLDVEVAARVVAGIAEGCRQANCVLAGGETAEMPGMYRDGDYDLAGFAVGAVERGAELTAERIGIGDALIGLASSGFHSNGYSLIRKVLERTAAAAPPIEALLAPTRIYVPALLPLLAAGSIHGMAHITGGGFVDNVPRILPQGTFAEIDPDAWPRPEVFDWVAEAGGVPAGEMLRTFNCGIGMVLAVAAEEADAVLAELVTAGEQPHRVGTVAAARDGEAPRVLFST